MTAGTTTAEDAGIVSGGGHRLVVREIVDETHDSRSVVFEVPPELAERFRFSPGQFLTLRIPAGDGGSSARCYSLTGDPELDGHLTVTVKRVAGGVASNWICDQLAVGHEMEVLPPAGRFVPRSLDATLLLFAGGSGITPIMSIARSVLDRGTGTVVLVYANRDEKSVIFAEQLRELAARHPERLTVLHLLQSVEGLPSVGRLRQIARPFADRDTAFVCGPGPFMDAVSAALYEVGMAREQVVVERFRSLSTDPFEQVETVAVDAGAGGDADAATLAVTLDGVRHEVDWPRTAVLLDVLRGRGLDAPFSCREGACSACACKIKSGRVGMLRNQVLEAEDLDEGWVLGCQAVPLSDEVEATYDE